MNKEKLIGISQDIDTFFESASQAFQQLKDSIKLGNVKKAADTHKKMLDVLTESEQFVQDLIKKRDDSKRIVSKVEADIKNYSDLESKYQLELTRLQSDFLENHWSDIPSLYQSIQREVAELKADLPNVHYLLQVEVQDYNQAFELALRIQKHVIDLQSKYNDCFKRYESLQYTHKKLQFRINQLESDVSRLSALINKEGLSVYIEELHSLGDEIRFRTKESRQTPIDLERIQSSIEELERKFKELEKYVQHTIRQKRDVEREWQEKERAYSQAQHRYGRGISTRSYDSQYQGIRSDVQGLISNGDYEQARGKISQLSSMTRNMKRDYDQHRLHQRNRNQSTRNAASFIVGTQVGKSMSDRNRNHRFPSNSGSRGASGGFGSRNSGSRGAGGSFGGSRGGSRGAGGSFKKR